MKLSDYPYVVLRLHCGPCRRNGTFKLARLAVRFGPEADVYDVIIPRLAEDCPYLHRRINWMRGTGCHAKLIDLEPPRAAPDLPFDGLKVIPGGKP